MIRIDRSFIDKGVDSDLFSICIKETLMHVVSLNQCNFFFSQGVRLRHFLTCERFYISYIT